MLEIKNQDRRHINKRFDALTQTALGYRIWWELLSLREGVLDIRDILIALAEAELQQCKLSLS